MVWFKRRQELQSVNVVYDLAREIFATQQQGLSSIDAKANFIFTSATLLMTGAIAAVAQLGTGSGTVLLICNWHMSRVIPLLIAFASYFGVMWATYQAYRMRKVQYPGQPDGLLKDYLHVSERDFKRWLAEDIAKAFNTNHQTIEDKAKWTARAFKLLLVEVGILAIVIGVEIYR